MQKILVVESERLLGAAIVSLLDDEENLNVLGFTPDTASKLVDKIIQVCPDVVIIDLTSHLADAIQRLPVQSRARLRLITVSADDNWVNIDHRHHVLITKRTDLANIIQSSQGQLPIEKSNHNHKGETSSYSIP